jgi:RNA recognition motif-containing protein
MVEPNQTLYVKNLNEKVDLPGAHSIQSIALTRADLKQHLEALFGQYGTIEEIKATKNIRMRGQAFIVFSSVEEATSGLVMNHYPLFNKPMVHPVFNGV